MVRIYRGAETGTAPKREELASGVGSETILLSPLIAKERVEELTEYFGSVQNSAVKQIFKTGRDGWNPDNPRAFMNIDSKECKIFLPSGLNRRMRGQRDYKEYKLPMVSEVYPEFSPYVNNKFGEHFSSFREANYLAKNCFEQKEIDEKMRIRKEVEKCAPVLSEQYLDGLSRSLPPFLGVPRYIVTKNIGKDFDAINAAKGVNWKSNILADYNTFHEEIYYSCSTKVTFSLLLFFEK